MIEICIPTCQAVAMNHIMANPSRIPNMMIDCRGLKSPTSWISTNLKNWLRKHVFLHQLETLTECFRAIACHRELLVGKANTKPWGKKPRIRNDGYGSIGWRRGHSMAKPIFIMEMLFQKEVAFASKKRMSSATKSFYIIFIEGGLFQFSSVLRDVFRQDMNIHVHNFAMWSTHCYGDVPAKCELPHTATHIQKHSVCSS